MLSNFYESGGWGMYPTTIFGFLLVAAGVLMLLRPERRYLPLTAGLGVLTASSGILGCSVGFINTFRYIQTVDPDKQLSIAAIGCAESLNNVVLAFLLVVFTALLATAGMFRKLRSTADAG